MKGSKLKQTVIKQSYLLPLLLMVVLLAGCKTSKVVKTTPVEPAYLSSKLQLTVKDGEMKLSMLNVSMAKYLPKTHKNRKKHLKTKATKNSDA